jgi:hypothetical protein
MKQVALHILQPLVGFVPPRRNNAPGLGGCGCTTSSEHDIRRISNQSPVGFVEVVSVVGGNEKVGEA